MNSRAAPKFPLHRLAQQEQQFLVGQTVVEARGEASWLAFMRVAAEERIRRLGRGGRRSVDSAGSGSDDCVHGRRTGKFSTSERVSSVEMRERKEVRGNSDVWPPTSLCE